MNSVNVKIALAAVLVLAASASQANDYLGHRDRKVPGSNSYAMVHQFAPASPGLSAWDQASRPAAAMCPLLEGYPDCH